MARRKYKHNSKLKSHLSESTQDFEYKNDAGKTGRKHRKYSKMKMFKFILIFLFLFAGVFTYYNFSLIYQEFLYFTLHRETKDAEVVVYGENDFNPFANQSNEKPTIIATNSTYSIIVPKLGMNLDVQSGIEITDHKEIQNAIKSGLVSIDNGYAPGEKNAKTLIIGHYPTVEEISRDINSPFLITYKLRKSDIVYVMFNNEVIKYKVTNSFYKFKNVKDTLLELDATDDKGLFLIGYGPLFENTWTYIVKAEQVY